jgi:hypothetical protein
VRHDRKPSKALLKVLARPIPRIGTSGAKVFVATFGSHRPYIVKIDAQKDIDKEAGALRDMCAFFPDTDGWHATPANANRDKPGGIAYKHQVAISDNELPLDAGDVGELEGLLLDSAVDSARMVAKMKEVFDTCFAIAHAKGEIKMGDRTLYADYERLGYLRSDRTSDSPPYPNDVIASSLGLASSSDERPEAGADGFETVNPLHAVAKFFRREVKCACGPIHGDLHFRNIMLDKRHSAPHLIDFKWAAPLEHIMADFTMLEATLRFFNVPRHLSLEVGRSLNKSLLEEGGWSDCDHLLVGNAPDLVNYGNKLPGLLKLVRETARAVIERSCGPGSFEFNEYLASLFLMLYGNCHYTSAYNIPLSVDALCRLAARLRYSDFGNPRTLSTTW